jgi:hypothetical protein
LILLPASAIKAAGAGPSAPEAGEGPSLEHVQTEEPANLVSDEETLPIRVLDDDMVGLAGDPDLVRSVGVPERKIRRIELPRRDDEEEETKLDRSSALQAGIEQGIALFLLVLLTLSPLFAWLHIESDYNGYVMVRSPPGAVPVRKEDRWDFHGIASWQGKTILSVSVLVSLLAAATLILRCAFDVAWSDRLITISRCVTGAWGGCVLVCLLGVALKGWAVSGTLQTPSGERVFRVVPHVGVWLGMAIALAIVLFSFSFSRHRGRIWWLLAQGAGVLFALLVVLALVQPWRRTSVWGLPLGAAERDIREFQVHGK